MTAPKFRIGERVSIANNPHRFMVLEIRPDFKNDEVAYFIQMVGTNVRMTVAESILKANR